MALKAGSRYQSIMRPEDAAWTPMGSTGQYAEVMGVVEPDDGTAYLNHAQGNSVNQDIDLKKKKFDLISGLLSGYKGLLSGQGSASMSPYNNIPMPSYMDYQPVMSQGQVDAQANLQRGNLLSQATNSSRSFNNNLASRGFSPYSPFGMANQQSNLMRANAGAAANETNLNVNAATANSDARIKTGGVNASLYGDYARSLASQDQINSNFYLQDRQQQADLLKLLLAGLG